MNTVFGVTTVIATLLLLTLRHSEFSEGAPSLLRPLADRLEGTNMVQNRALFLSCQTTSNIIVSLQ